MALEEYGKYQTVSWKKVHMRSAMKQEEMMYYYRWELIEMLGIVNESDKNKEEILSDHKVLVWLTDDLIMPSGFWDNKTGKCLWWNTGWVMWRGNELRKKLSRFDIETEE